MYEKSIDFMINHIEIWNVPNLSKSDKFQNFSFMIDFETFLIGVTVLDGLYLP